MPHRRAPGRQQPRHYPISVRLSVSSHFLISAPPRFRSYLGDNLSGTGGRFDGFCLVSSDSDFTRLASRLREQGADVYGFGEQKTPESFRQACRRFIYTENLLPEAQVVAPEEGPSPKALEPPSAAIPILNKAITQMETEDGWVGLG